MQYEDWGTLTWRCALWTLNSNRTLKLRVRYGISIVLPLTHLYSANLDTLMPCKGNDFCFKQLHLVLVYYYYHPQTKLWEGNVFTDVCLCFRLGTGVGISHASWDRLHGRVPPGYQTWNLPPPPLLLTSGGHHCSNLFTWGLPPPPPVHLRLVILLKCCHVLYYY